MGFVPNAQKDHISTIKKLLVNRSASSTHTTVMDAVTAMMDTILSMDFASNALTGANIMK